MRTLAFPSAFNSFIMTTCFFSLVFVSMTFLTSCPLGLSGSIRVVISSAISEHEPPVDGALLTVRNRTLLPTIQAHTYRLMFSGPSNTEFEVETSDTVIERNLSVGEWSISAQALDDSARIVASGSITGVVVSAIGTGQVAIPLTPGMSATGTIDVTLTWPADLVPSIENISGTLGTADIPASSITFIPLEHTARYSSIQPSGNYKLEFSLVWGEYEIKPGLEAVQVYDFLTTTGTINVTTDYFVPPNAPSNLTAIAGVHALNISWIDNSDVETGFEIQRSIDGVNWFNLPTTTLPENTTRYSDTTAEAGVEYTYRVRASNSIGQSDYCPASSPASWVIVQTNRIINHTHYDPGTLSNEAILTAAALRVYFEHASVGNDIVGDSDTDSSTGGNFNGSEDCGLALLHAEINGSRYLCERETYYENNNASWYTSHTGLQTNDRSNPPTPEKLSGFLELSEPMRSAVDVAMFKFCWIDGIDGNISGGASFAADLIAQIELFEAANPGLIVPYWTMPIQTNESFQTREAYNNAIRSYCTSHGKWLLDIADLECHNAAGIKRTDGEGREIMYDEYAMPDGGHLAAAGRLKLAKAYWTLIAGVAAELAEPEQ